MFARAVLRRIPLVRQFSLARRPPTLRPYFLLNRRFFASSSLRRDASTTAPPPTSPELTVPEQPPDFLPPPYCPGCGAPSQQVTATLPGYYSCRPSRRQRFGADNLKIKSKQKQREDEIWESALARIQSEQTAGLPPSLTDAAEHLDVSKDAATTPVCARCHTIVHHHRAQPLPSYPTLDTLTGLLLASRHTTNHVYHLVDAADLPLSLVPHLRAHLYSSLPREITRGLTLSYVVTRADLLMPTEAQLRSLATWIKKVLKDALPPGEKVEGRNEEEGVHIVSARRGWGVGKIKLQTRHREGGVWVVGAVNVGKSRLVREVWPEAGEGLAGSVEDAGEFGILPEAPEGVDGGEAEVTVGVKEDGQRKKQGRGVLMQVPPTVSDMPGTTAAPIRVRFKTAGGVGKKVFGELVDLPGLERWVGFGDNGLLPFVREDKRKEFAIEKLVVPEQYTIKPGQSMLIAGVILITPKISPTDELVILAYPFTSLPVHITSTRKALQQIHDPDPASRTGISLFQKAPSSPSEPPPSSLSDPSPSLPPVDSFIHPDASTLPAHFSSAGTYALCNEVTQFRNPFLPSKEPSELAKLPYRVLATDLLLSGIGWVELVVQVRQRRDVGDVCVEVFTPHGKGVGQRITMGADMLRKKGARLVGAAKKTGRPRRSMKGDKKRRKIEKKTQEAQEGA